MAILDRRVTFAQFLEMLEKQDRSLEGRTILLNAIEHSKYSTYLKRWYDALGRERVYVLLFEDMVASPVTFMVNLSSILRIDKKFYKTYNFSRKNETVLIRSRTLHRLKPGHALTPGSPRIQRLLSWVYKWINVKKTMHEKRPEDRKLLDKLDQVFVPYNEELRKVAGIDIDQWA